MSAKQLAWAMSRKGISPVERVVLMILADRSDKNGWSYYAQETIAVKAEVSRKTARRALEDLERKGFITRAKRSIGNLRTSDHIQISLGNSVHQTGTNLPTIPNTPYGVVISKDKEASRDGKILMFPAQIGGR